MEKQLDTELKEKDLPRAITEEEISTMVNPGDEVPGGFTYPNNAVIQNKSLNLKYEDGSDIGNRYVSIGDKITVLKIDADKQLALVQYPSGSIVREGYITNDTSAIKYLNEYDWANGSTSEPVYETESSSDGKWGTLSPYEKATRLYKKDSRTCVAYDTSKGKFTKSGFVDYEGGASSGGSSDSSNGIKPGEIVPGGFTYPNNAVVQNDSLYLRDENGNQIAGRSVSIGDEITVLDVGYTKQLALIQYPTSSGVVQGYVTNSTNIISYKNPYNWVNGSTPEPVYSSATSTDSGYGTLSAREAATLLYKEGNRYHVVYDTSKGPLTKSGYVDYEGTGETGGSGVDTDITIPVISHSEIELKQYGESGKGRPLNVYKIGNGSKAVFAGFAIHGWEDNWNNDGLALVKLANALALKIADYKAQNGGLHGWTVYIAPCMNPDGVIVSGTTGAVGATTGPGNNGIGRCAVTTRIDLNRCFPDGFVPQYSSRNYTGSTSLGAPEAVALKNYVQNLNSSYNEVVVIDGHGWLGCVYGNSSIASYFTSQFGISYKGGSGGGYFSYWAGNLSKTRAILLEYPQATYSYNDVINKNYIGKTYNAIVNMIGGNPGTDNGSGSNGSGSSNGDEAYSATGKVINVTTTLNVREQASTSSNIVGTLSAGETVTITAKNGVWYKISSPKVGYVHSDYININSNGDANTPTLNEMETVINMISELVISAIEFSKKYVVVEPAPDIINRLTSDYLIHVKYGDSSWAQIIGNLNNIFINFVKNNYPNLCNKLDKYINNSNIEIKFGKSLIDLPHLMATTRGYYSSLSPDFWTGWGGDLSTLVGEITYKCRENTTEKNNKAYELLASKTQNTTFGNGDFYSDIDSIYLGKKFHVHKIDDLLYMYYIKDKSYTTRKNIILNDLPKAESVSDAIYNKLTGVLGYNFPLVGEKLKSFSKKYNGNAVEYSDESVKACCNALAKKINELDNSGFLQY